MGTACTQASGLMSAQHESAVKRMQHGFAARSGLFAALMSEKGYTGIDQVFERSYGGYLATFGQGSGSNPPYLENELVKSLGKDWAGVNGIRVKKYSSMIATHAPIDCLAALQERYPKKFEHLNSIRQVKIEQSKAAHAHGGQSITRPITAIGAQMSTRYIAAVQLLDHQILIDQFQSSNLDRDSIWQLVDKVDCQWNSEFDEKSSWNTRVSVVFEGGETVTEEVTMSETIENCLPGKRIREKWRMLAGRVLDEKIVHQLEDAILNLEAVDDMSEISGLLEGKVRGVFDD